MLRKRIKAWTAEDDRRLLNCAQLAALRFRSLQLSNDQQRPFTEIVRSSWLGQPKPTDDAAAAAAVSPMARDGLPEQSGRACQVTIHWYTSTKEVSSASSALRDVDSRFSAATPLHRPRTRSDKCRASHRQPLVKCESGLEEPKGQLTPIAILVAFDKIRNRRGKLAHLQIAPTAS
jgi:hypothetical protein